MGGNVERYGFKTRPIVMEFRKKIAVNLSAACEKNLRQYAADCSYCCILDSNSTVNFTVPGAIEYECLIAFDALQIFWSEPLHNVYDRLFKFHQKHSDWLFGHLSYELKNQTENLKSNNPGFINFPDVSFFVPRYLFIKKQGTWHALLHDREAENINTFLTDCESKLVNQTPNAAVSPKAVLTKSEYIKRVSGLKHHIKMGDIYEANFCHNFAATGSLKKPYSVYDDLRAFSPTPYGAFYRVNSNYLMCASPEEYLKKRGSKLTSRPIKGTSKRGTNPADDEDLRQKLYNDEKERAENVMIVDLVRNDLSRCAKQQTVQVEELFGIYDFPGVYQMISTVTCELKPETPFTDAFKYTFPPGSMTGAPKIRAMELIEAFEEFKRNIYSGSVGYITPEGDFDFNVVIRSVFYDAATECVSFAVGGAITDLCHIESEYEESLLKAKSMVKVLAKD